MNISDEAVEAAAKGIFALDQGQHMDRAELEAAWERLPSETERDDYRYAARAALEAAAPIMGQPMIPEQAIIAAKEAMREVTPPPGVSKAGWLAEYGDFALIAGAIAAAAPYMRVISAADIAAVADMIKAAKANGWDEGAEASAEHWAQTAHNPNPNGPIDPPTNPYRSQS